MKGEMRRERLRALVVISAPIAGKHGTEGPPLLDALGEWQGIARQLGGANAAVHLRRLLPPTFEKLQGELARQPGYHVVHFIGHGAAGGVILEDELGCADEVQAANLGALFKEAGVRVVILNLCESAAGARPAAQALVDAGVRTAVGTARRIRDDHAVLLADRIYAMLGSGKTIGEAVEAAKQALAQRFGGKAAENVVLVGDAKARPVERAAEGEVSLDAGEPPGADRLPSTLGFVGRRMELLRAAELLRSSDLRGVVLTGIGGIGKTWLAAEAARRNCWRFSGIVWVSAKDQPRFGVSDILAEMALALGLDIGKIPGEKGRERAALEVLNGRAVLIALDNLETVEASQRRAVAAFLDGVGRTAGSKFLLTCRERLEEFERLAGTAPVNVGPLDEDAAARLMLRLAEERVPQVTGILALSKRELGDLVRDAGCNPFVLGLVVADASKQGLDAARKALRELTGPWEQRVEELIGRQVRLLKPEGRAVLMRLPVFVGSVDRLGLESAVGSGPDLDEGLRQVVEASLAEYDGVRERWSLHQVVLDYARKNLPPAPDEEAQVRGKAAWHYAALAGVCGDRLSGEEALGALALFEQELGNIRAARRWARESCNWRLSVSAAYQADDPLERLGLWAERIEWLREGLDAARRGGESRHAGALAHNLGVALAQTGQYAEARRLYEESLAIARELGDRADVSKGLHNLGVLAQDQGDCAGARRLHEESLAIARELGDRADVSKGLHNLGVLAQDQGDCAGARRLHEESLAIKRELGDRAGVSKSLHALGALAQDQGDHGEARRLYEGSLAMLREVGDRAGVSKSLYQLGILAQRQGDYAEAGRLYEESLAIKRELGDRAGVGRSLGRLGTLAEDTGNLREAAELFQQAAEIFRDIGAKRELAMAEAALGRVRRRMGAGA
jgi:tetratricopeptide (TPR) repeat protein